MNHCWHTVSDTCTLCMNVQVYASIITGLVQDLFSRCIAFSRRFMPQGTPLSTSPKKGKKRCVINPKKREPQLYHVRIKNLKRGRKNLWKRCFRPDFGTIFSKHRNSWRDILKGRGSLKYLIKLLPTRKVFFYLFVHRVYNFIWEFLQWNERTLKDQLYVQNVYLALREREREHLKHFQDVNFIKKWYSKSTTRYTSTLKTKLTRCKMYDLILILSLTFVKNCSSKVTERTRYSIYFYINERVIRK